MNDTLSTTKEKEVIWEENHSTELTQKSENKIASEAISSMLITETDSAKNGCKNIGKISGIYKIINKVNNKYYVGSSNDVKKRWREHRGELKKKIHVNDHLQKSWNKYGENAFEFVLIEQVSPIRQILINTEQPYLDVAKAHKDKCYNMNFEATGADPNEYIIEKCRLKALALWQNPEYAEKVSTARRGIPSHRKGKHISEETRQKIIASRLHGKDDPRYGIPLSEETKAKIRETKRKRKEILLHS